MAHIHSVYDTDTHFKIDGITREVTNVSDVKVMVAQFDHDSERFTFELPRYIDGHDMTDCNVVQVHYINTSASDPNKYTEGVYEVYDLQVSPDSEDVAICSWLISANATQHAGKLAFVLRFVCSASEGALDYVWNTAIHSKVSVVSSIYNGDAVEQEYPDVLAQFETRIAALDGRTTELEQNGGGGGTVWHYGTLITGEGEEIFMPVAGAKAGDFYLNSGTGETYIAVHGATRSAEKWKYICTMGGGASGVSSAVLYAAQELTEEQKAQARANIGAVSTAYVISVFEEIKATLEESDVEDAIAVLDEAILDLSTLA
jgi:hypothetical protein